jgi:hypothetical protein
MKELEQHEVEEVQVKVAPPKVTVDHGDVFFDRSTHYNVMATTLSDSSGWRYLRRVVEGGPDVPDGTVPDSDLLDGRLYMYLYHQGRS